MKKLLLILIPLAAVAGWFVYQAKTELPSVPFAKTSRERLSATLSTNGKVEPLSFTEVRALTSGRVQHLRFKQGEEVQAGQALAEMSQPGDADDLAAAEARLGQTKAELAALEAGGRSVDIAEIEGTQARLRTQRDVDRIFG